MMAGEVIGRVLADLAQLQACAENPGREVTGGIRIAPDRQAAIAQSFEAGPKLGNYWNQEAGVHAGWLRQLTLRADHIVSP
jgi:hypothetical protein